MYENYIPGKHPYGPKSQVMFNRPWMFTQDSMVHKHTHTHTHTHKIGDCGTPLINSSTISVWYASNFTTKDSILIYHCSEGYIPADLKTAVCYHNGSWIPDPTNLKCTGMLIV